MKGIKMKTSPWRRPSPDTAPVHAKAAGLYMICTLSKHAAEAEGCDDALMLDWRGHVAEATGANIFLRFDDDKLHTPHPRLLPRRYYPAHGHRTGQGAGHRNRRAHHPARRLAGASEVFLTGTAAEVTPVGRIDDHAYTPGRISQTLMEDYETLVGKAEAGKKASAA